MVWKTGVGVTTGSSIQNRILKRRVGLALSDTLSSPTCGQQNGEKIEPKRG